MKRIFIGVFTVISIVVCAISQSSTNGWSKVENFINPPNTFSSEKDLRANLWISESHEYEAAGKKFFVCLSSGPSASVTEDRVTCWYHLPNSERLLRVWDVRLVDAGPMKFDYEPKTTRLSVSALANFKVENTQMKGQPLASVILTLLGTNMGADFKLDTH